MAYVLAANRKMLKVFRKTGYVIHRSLEDGVYEIQFHFDEPAVENKDKKWAVGRGQKTQDS